jgi:LPS export ABC transporter protein LptC
VRAGVLLFAAVFIAQSAPARAETAPGLMLQGVTFIGSRGAVNDVVLEAERARVDPEARVAHLETVRASVRGGPRGKSFDMTCERGEYDLETGNFRAEGRVRGMTDEGRRFSTTWLRYDHAADLVSTDAPVVIDDATGRFSGGGFRYHVQEGRFRLLGGAQVQTQ